MHSITLSGPRSGGPQSSILLKKGGLRGYSELYRSGTHGLRCLCRILLGYYRKAYQIISDNRSTRPRCKSFPEKRPKWLWALHDTFLLPTVRRHNPVLWVFLMLFHVSLLLLIIGHLELFKEFEVLQIVQHEIFLGRGFIGLILCIALLFFLFRRFVSPNRELSVPEDYYLLILLFLTCLVWQRNGLGKKMV